MSIFKICNGKFEGWDDIKDYCVFKNKGNSKVLFECLLDMIDWNKTTVTNDNPGTNAKAYHKHVQQFIIEFRI